MTEETSLSQVSVFWVVSVTLYPDTGTKMCLVTVDTGPTKIKVTYLAWITWRFLILHLQMEVQDNETLGHVFTWVNYKTTLWEIHRLEVRLDHGEKKLRLPCKLGDFLHSWYNCGPWEVPLGDLSELIGMDLMPSLLSCSTGTFAYYRVQLEGHIALGVENHQNMLPVNLPNNSLDQSSTWSHNLLHKSCRHLCLPLRIILSIPRCVYLSYLTSYILWLLSESRDLRE
jgi:hypothetical protein